MIASAEEDAKYEDRDWKNLKRTRETFQLEKKANYVCRWSVSNLSCTSTPTGWTVSVPCSNVSVDDNYVVADLSTSVTQKE